MKMANSLSKKNRLIVFDFDGTIADTINLIFEIFNCLASKYGYEKISIKKFNRLRGLSSLEALKEMRFSWWRLPFILFLSRREGKKIVGQKILTVNPFKGMISFINYLKDNDCYLGIVTNNAGANVKSFLEKYGLDQFDFVIENKNLFNKNKALYKAIKNYSLPKNSIYYVGDEVKDVCAAKKNGIRSVAVTWGYNTAKRLAQEKPDFLVNNFEELEKVIFITGLGQNVS